MTDPYGLCGVEGSLKEMNELQAVSVDIAFHNILWGKG